MAVLASNAAAAPNEERAAIEDLCRSGPAALRARAAVLRGDALVEQADVLPNPTLAGEHNRSFTGPEDNETIVGLTIPLGIGGRRFILQDAAEQRRSAAMAEGDEVLLAYALDLREAMARARAELARADAMARQHEKLVRLAEAIAGLRKGGEASDHDELRHELEVRVHRERLALSKSRAAAAQALLATYAGRPVDIATLELADIGRGEIASERASKHPRVRGLDATLRAADLEEEAAERRWVPDVDLFVGYRAVAAVAAETGHGISVSLAVPLTLFDRGQGEAAASRAERAQAEAERHAFVQAQRAEGGAAEAALRALEEIPAAAPAGAGEAPLERQARALYLAGEGSLTELLSAYQATEAAELSAIDVAEAKALARIRRMRVAGSLFDAELDRLCRVGGGGR